MEIPRVGFPLLCNNWRSLAVFEEVTPVLLHSAGRHFNLKFKYKDVSEELKCWEPWATAWPKAKDITPSTNWRREAQKFKPKRWTIFLERTRKRTLEPVQRHRRENFWGTNRTHNYGLFLAHRCRHELNWFRRLGFLQWRRIERRWCTMGLKRRVAAPQITRLVAWERSLRIQNVFIVWN